MNKKDNKDLKKQVLDGINADQTTMLTQTIIEVLQSLNVIDESGKPKADHIASKINKTAVNPSQNKLFGSGYKPHVSSKFGMGDAGAAFDDILSESSQLPIFQVEGARSNFNKNRFAGVNSPGVSQGPIDLDKMRLASGMGGTPTGFGQGNTSFMGLQMDPMISNNFSMLNFSLSRSNPYMVNRQYGSGMYGDIPVYFMMMQEQNGGLLYWPVSIREKYQWFRYFTRSDPHVGSAIDLHTDLPISRIGFTMPKLKDDPDGSKARKCLNKCQKWADTIGLFDRLMEMIFEWNVIGNCFPGNHRVHTPKGMVPISEVRENDYVLTHKGVFHKVLKTMRRWTSERLVSIELDNINGFKFTPTKEHPILLRKNNEDIFVKASDVRRGDYVSLWQNNNNIEVSEINVVDDLKKNKILKSKYDEVCWLNNENIVVKYKTNGGVTYNTAEIKEKLLNYLSSIDSPVLMNCIDLAEKLEISDSSRLRNAAYSLKKKGAIKTKWINGKSKEGKVGGSSIKWYPLKNKLSVNDIYYREWEKELNLSIKNIKVDEDFMYLLGYWFGDGWLWKYKRQKSCSYLAWDICIDKKDKKSFKKLEEVCFRVFGEDKVSITDSSYCNDDLNHVIVEDPIFCEWWAYNFGENSSNKKIPEWVWGVNKDKLLSLLAGYIDSDGCATISKKGQKNISITSVTEELAQGMFKVGLSCGIPFSFSKNKPKISKMPNKTKVIGKEIYVLSTSRMDFIKHSGLDKKSSKVFKLDVENHKDSKNKGVLEIEGRFYYRISDISEEFYTGYVHNIEVETDHSYCVENINTHNCFAFNEWDNDKKWWKKITVLPPEEVGIVHFPFCDFAFAEYRPEPLIRLVTAVDGGAHTESSQAVTPLEKAIYDNIPVDIVNSIQQFGSILMDTDPMTGSFVEHIARKRSPYADLGISRLERVIIPLLQKEHFKYTQLSLSSRLMTPRNKIAAPGISPDATDNLRSEIDLSMEDPDYHVVTNFDFSWDLIGAENRLIALQPEYERIEGEILAALGVTRELITGEASYGGARLTAEILNTRYLLIRDIFKNFVEKKLLLPMAIQNGWYEEGDDGEQDFYYPKLTFNRLTIRDNQEMFDALFQLYQKGSLPIKIIYEMFNLNPDEMNDLLVDDLFTARDATFNEMTRQVHTDLGTKIVEQTDIFDRMVKYCGLTKADEEGIIQTTPVPDIGGDIFTAPNDEDENQTEDEPAEETPAEETSAEEAGATEEEGGLGAELEDLAGGEETQEETPAEETGGEEIIEE